MPYRLRYSAIVDYFPAGQGLGQAATAQPGLLSWSAPAGGLNYAFAQQVDPASNTFTNADVANMIAAMAADLTAQMEATATQQTIQNAGTFSAIPPPLGN